MDVWGWWTIWNWWASALLDLRRCPLTDCTATEAADLEMMLADTINEWAAKHGIDLERNPR